MGVSQPYTPPSLSANTRRNIPTATSAAPGRSRGSRLRARAGSLMTKAAPMIASGAITTLMPKDQRHE